MSGLPVPRTSSGRRALDAVLAAPARTLVALDYDGTLAPIVERPEDAVAAPGAADALRALAPLVGLVAVITGRPAADAVRLGGFADVPSLVVLGHYGLERWSGGEITTPTTHSAVPHARVAAAMIVAGAPSGVWLEDKGHSVAIHTRGAAEPAAALETVRRPVEQLAKTTGLLVTPGKFVLELRPPGTDKGGTLRAVVAETGPAAVVFAGDDLGDLAAVGALRELPVPGLVICSDSAETPAALRDDADLVVAGAAGVVEWLMSLAAKIGG
ncbi:MAG: trehalose-phosphatase [Jiangellaceae bacterium]|nr:trehalose-phosphatase [Jiangellaceae bacterium]